MPHAAPFIMMSLIVLMGVVFLFMFLSIGTYVLESFGLYTMAKNRKFENAWISWVPIINNYMIGALSGDEMWGMSGSRYVLGFGPLVIFLLNLTGIGAVLGFPLSIAYLVYYFMCLYKLFKIYRPESAALYTATSVIFQFMAPIWLFVIRNDKPDTTLLDKGVSDPEKMYQNVYNETLEEHEHKMEATPYQPYASVRESLDELEYEAPVQVKDVYTVPATEDVTISSMNDDQADEIESKIRELSASIDQYVNEEPFSEVVETIETKEEPSEKSNIELVFGDTVIRTDDYTDKDE